MADFVLGSAALAAGYRFRSFDTVGSTSDEAIAAARLGQTGPCWFVSDHQTAGRGRRGNAWSTPPGNLAASLLLSVDLPPATVAELGFVAGVSIVGALHRVALSDAIAPAFGLKWPNDVLAAGRKLVGILLQTEMLPSGRRAVVIGIGINVRHAPPAGASPYPATSLSDLGLGAGPDRVFEALTDAWCAGEALWDSGRGFAAIREAWLKTAAGLGDDIMVSVSDRTVAGRFETIDGSGRLVLRDSAGTQHHVSAGDVHFGGARTLRSVTPA